MKRTLTRILALCAAVCGLQVFGDDTTSPYGGTIFTFDQVDSQTDLAHNKYTTTTYSDGTFSIASDATYYQGWGTKATDAADTTKSILSTVATAYNTIRFASGHGDSVTTPIFTFTPLAIAGVIVASDAAQTGISSDGTGYGRAINYGKSGLTANSTIDKDFTFSTASANSAITFAGTQTLTVGSTATLTLNAGTGSIVNNATLTISGGTVKLSSPYSGTGTTTIASGATLDLSGISVTLSSAIQNSGTVKVDGSTQINFTGAAADGYYTIVNGGTIDGSIAVSQISINGVVLGSRQTLTTTSGIKVSAATAKTLTWAGASGNNTWSTATTDTPWTGSKYFINAVDSVTFGSGADYKTVNVSGTVQPAAMTLHGEYAFNGDGKVSVTDDTLTMSSGDSITLGENTVIDFGSRNDGSFSDSQYVTGSGTIVLENKNGGHDVVTGTLNNDFTGTLEFHGAFNPNSYVNINNSVKLALYGGQSVGLWRNGPVNLANAVCFKTDYKIYSNSGARTFTGAVSSDAGKTLYINGGSNTIQFGGTTQLANVNLTEGTVNFNGVTTADLIVGSGGTYNINNKLTTTRLALALDNANATVNVAADAVLNIQGTDTANHNNNSPAYFAANWGQATTTAINGTFNLPNAGISVRDGAAKINVNNGGELNLGKGFTYANNTANATITMAEGSRMNIGENGMANNSLGLVVNGGTIGSLTDSWTLARALTLNGATTIDTAKRAINTDGKSTAVENGTSAITASGVISGTGNLTKTGAGTLALTAANTLTGLFKIDGGKVMVGPNNGTQAGSSTAQLTDTAHGVSALVASGAELEVHSEAEFKADVFLKNGAILSNRDKHPTLSGDIYFGVADSCTGTDSVTYNTDSTVNYNEYWAKTITLSGGIKGMGIVNLNAPTGENGTANFKLTGSDNTFAGDYKVNSTSSSRKTTIYLGTETAAKQATVTLTSENSTLSLGADKVTIAGLAGTAGSVALDSGTTASTLTVNQTAETSYAGTIAGAITLVKSGEGKLTLSGANTYMGGTTISAGELVATTSDAVSGLGAVTFTGAGLLTLPKSATAPTMTPVSDEQICVAAITDDTITYTSGTPVSTVDETGYSTFAAAVTAANGSTITLCKNTSYVCTDNSTFKVQLNDHTLAVTPADGYYVVPTTADGVTTYTSKPGEAAYVADGFLSSTEATIVSSTTMTIEDFTNNYMIVGSLAGGWVYDTVPLNATVCSETQTDETAGTYTIQMQVNQGGYIKAVTVVFTKTAAGITVKATKAGTASTLGTPNWNLSGTLATDYSTNGYGVMNVMAIRTDRAEGKAFCGTTVYDDLSTAISEATTDSTVYVLDDITTDDAGLTVATGSFTLDLNGHTLTSSGTGVTLESTMTLENGTVKSTGASGIGMYAYADPASTTDTATIDHLWISAAYPISVNGLPLVVGTGIVASSSIQKAISYGVTDSVTVKGGLFKGSSDLTDTSIIEAQTDKAAYWSTKTSSGIKYQTPAWGTTVATIGSTNYASLKDAVNAASDGDTITLSNNAESTVTIGKGTTDKPIVISGGSYLASTEITLASGANVRLDYASGNALKVAAEADCAVKPVLYLDGAKRNDWGLSDGSKFRDIKLVIENTTWMWIESLNRTIPEVDATVDLELAEGVTVIQNSNLTVGKLTGKGSFVQDGPETAGVLTITKDCTFEGAYGGKSYVSVNEGVKLTLADTASLNKVSGAGTVVIASISKTFTIDEGWTGTVWLTNITNVAGQFFSNWGNANSTVRLTGVKGWIDRNSGAVATTIELVDDGDTAAFIFTAGSSATYVFNKIKGTGTLDVQQSGDGSSYIQVKNAPEFSGVAKVEIPTGSGKVDLIFSDTANSHSGSVHSSIIIDQNMTIAKNWTAAGEIIVNSGATATLNSDVTMTAGTNLVNGVLIANGTFTGTLQGSGTVYLNNGWPTDTIKSNLQAAEWTGTAVLKGGPAEGGFNVDQYGNANSTIQATGVSTWVNNGRTCFDRTLTLVDGGDDTKAFSMSAWSYSFYYTFAKIAGSGTFVQSASTVQTDSNCGNNKYGAFTFKDVSDFTGSLLFTKAGIVIGTGDTSFLTSDNPATNKIVITAGTTATVAAGKTWRSGDNGTIIVNGTLTVEPGATIPSTMTTTLTNGAIATNTVGTATVYTAYARSSSGTVEQTVENPMAVTNTVSAIVAAGKNPTGIYTYTKDGVTTTHTCVAVTNTLTTTTVGVMAAETTVADFLDTSLLTKDDTLSVYDSSKSGYISFTLRENKTWSYSGQDQATAGITPESTKLKAGQAAWITKAAGSKVVQIIKGELSTEPSTEATASAVTLAALPSLTSKSVSEITPTIDKATATSKVELFVPAKDGNIQYVWAGSQWYRLSLEGTTTKATPVTEETGDVIETGTGFMIRNRNTEAATIK